MTLSAVLLVNRKGEVLINRAYKDDVSRIDILLFCQKVVAAKETFEKPIQRVGQSHFIHIVADDVVVVAATKQNSNVTLIVRVLYKFVEVFNAYFGDRMNEELIKKKFPLVYELLDEMMDFGVPQILEVDALKRYITQGDAKACNLENKELQEKICAQATGAISWRAENIKHRKNEVYIDVVEQLNVLFSQKGQVLRADVAGQINVNSLLSGMPECKFGVNDKLVAGGNRVGKSSHRSIVMDDVRCHQCVRLGRFESQRTITFIPPDGKFTLMRYRITENVHIPFHIFPVVQERGKSRIECSVKVKSNFGKILSASNVILRIPCPKNTAQATTSSLNAGKVKFESSENALVWRIRRFPGETEYTMYAEVQLVPTVADQQWVRPPITMDFNVPSGNYSASGLSVRFLLVQEKSGYKPLKWIRYITTAGTSSFQHRI